MAAWIIGGSGVLLSLWVGCGRFAFSFGDVFFWVGLSNMAALIGVLLTLRLEKTPWLKASVLAGTARTWIFLSAVYLGLLLLPDPALRDPFFFREIILPLLLSTGLMLNPILGPIQDRIVQNAQRRERQKTRLATDQP